MVVKVMCPHCQQACGIPESDMGKPHACPRCRNPIIAHTPETAVTVLASPPPIRRAHAERGPGSMTDAFPEFAGIPLTRRNVAIAAGGLVALFVFVAIFVVILMRGQSAEAEVAANEAAVMAAQEAFKQEVQAETLRREEHDAAKLAARIEKDREDLDRLTIEVAQRRDFFAKVRHTLDDLAKDYRDQERRMRRNYEDALANADDTQKAVLKKKFDAEQRRNEDEKRNREWQQQKLLEETKAKLDESSRALQAAEERQKIQQRIVQQPVVVPAPIIKGRP